MVTYVYFIQERLSPCKTQRLKLCLSITHGGEYKLEVKIDGITKSKASTSWGAVSYGDFTSGCSQPFSTLGCKTAYCVQVHSRDVALKDRQFYKVEFLLFSLTRTPDILCCITQGSPNVSDRGHRYMCSQPFPPLSFHLSPRTEGRSPVGQAL
jgi:hypothetical protein